RHDRAAIARRRNFGEVERRQHRGEADSQPDKEAADQQRRQIRRHGREDRTGDKEQSGPQNDAGAAKPNRQSTAAAAPIAAPASTMATTMPYMVGERANSSRRKRSAPEITPVS